MKRSRSSGSDLAVETALRSLDRAVTSGSADRIELALEERRQHRRRRRLGLTTATACVFAAWMLWRGPAPTVTAPVAKVDSTAVVVAPATRTLPDGSTVESRADAQFDLEFSPAERRVVLRAGEAHFAVEKDPARPFVVVAGGVEVRAVGTAFSVEFGERAVAVLVTEGRVALAAPAVDAAARTSEHLLDAGMRAVVPRQAGDPAPHIAPITVAETTDRLAWRVRRLEFSGTPLAEAVPMFNRHAGTRLTLDRALGHLRVSGALRADDVDALLFLLGSEFGIAAQPQSDGTVALRRR